MKAVYRRSKPTTATSHLFCPVRKDRPLVITVQDEDIPEVVLLQCGAQVIGDEVALFLWRIPTAVDAEVNIVTIAGFVLRGQGPNIYTFLLVGLQEAAMRITNNFIILSDEITTLQ
jgi:hypothetical protein